MAGVTVDNGDVEAADEAALMKAKISNVLAMQAGAFASGDDIPCDGWPKTPVTDDALVAKVLSWIKSDG